MRPFRAFKVLTLAFMASLAAFAQVEPQLSTVTDLSDVYKQTSSKSEAICVFDTTPISRAAFEPYKYLTTGGRMAWVGRESNGQFSNGNYNSTVASLFNPSANDLDGKVLGLAFGLRVDGNVLPEVRLYWWPKPTSSTAALKQPYPNNNPPDIIGTPMETRADGTVVAISETGLSLAKVIARTTHVRFAIKLSSTLTRTIDVPCPWKIWDSPSGSAVNIPSSDTTGNFRNYQRNTFTVTKNDGTTVSGVLYDPWSEYIPSSVTTANYSYTRAGESSPVTVTIPNDTTQVATSSTFNSGLGATNWVQGTIGANWGTNPDPKYDVKIGQFFYTADYMAFIFGGKAKRYLDPSDGTIDWVSPATATDTAATSYSGGYTIPDAVSDTITPPGGSSAVAAAGWLNGLSGMSRYQALKSAAINVYIQYAAKVDVAYRFLDPNYGTAADGGNHEEVRTTPTTGTTTFGTNASTSASALNTNTQYSSTDLRALRLISPDSLATTSEPIQLIGPRDYDFFPVSHNFGKYDSSSPDPGIPQPLNYALANTYQEVADPNSVFNASRTNAPCGKSFVLLFPGQGMNDSLNSAFDENATQVPAPGNAAGNGNGGGSYASANNSTSLLPSAAGFFGGVLSSIAAFGTASASGQWGAPWGISAGGNSRKIQTMVLSVGVPGAYHFKSSNAGQKSPHENLFLLAQWADPSRTSWSQRNGQPSVQDLPIQIKSSVSTTAQQRAKVFYYVGSDPQALQDALGSALSYIVNAEASLAAPATPATGVRSGNQAYFGTFHTTLDTNTSSGNIQKYPLWSGNLYSVGILRKTVVVTDSSGNILYNSDGSKQTREKLSFYGYDALGVNNSDPTDHVTGTPDYDLVHLWAAYDIFASATASGQYGYYTPDQSTSPVTPAAHTGSGLLSGAPLLWSSRTMYTMVQGNRVAWPSGSESSAGSGTALEELTTGAVKTSAGANLTLAQAKELARWVRGAYNASNKRPSDTTGSTNDPLNNTYNRQDIMGDIVNSAPLTVELNTSDAQSMTGIANPFTASKYKDSTTGAYLDLHARLVIVGSNVGQLHCFFEWSAAYPLLDASNVAVKDDAGRPLYLVDAKATELWSFVPRDCWQALWDLYQNRTSTSVSHIYMVDGDPALYHVDLPPSDTTLGTLPDTRVGRGSWSTATHEDAVVIFGFRKGARSYYALQLSSSTTNSISPTNFTIAWYINPLNPTVVGSSNLSGSKPGFTGTDAALVRAMGMSTAVPVIASVNSGSYSATPTTQDVVFLSGGYSNNEMDQRFKALDNLNTTSYYSNGMGRSILGLNPITGAKIRFWDLSTVSGMGAIADGVTPVRIFRGELSQRLYFADWRGGIYCINNGATSLGSTTAATDYRLDSAFIGDWITTPRIIYKDSANSRYMRFTTRPDAFRLSGGFPATNAEGINPLTVIVAIGSGDRNNPTDRAEDFSILKPGTSGVTSQWWRASSQSWVTQASAYLNTYSRPTTNRFLVLADRQDSKARGRDISGISDSDLWNIPNDGTGWTTSYSDTSSNPNVVVGHANYLFPDDKVGYYINLGRGSLTDAYNGITYDKILVPPLIKQNALFFSVFDIANGAGYSCAPNAFTRTYRQCDIMRPLAMNVTNTSTTVLSLADVNDLNRNSDTCSGLAFFFNSLSSQLVDEGSRVLQGGAVSEGGAGFGTQATRNTPSIQNVKDSSNPPSPRIRAWRVVR